MNTSTTLRSALQPSAAPVISAGSKVGVGVSSGEIAERFAMLLTDLLAPSEPELVLEEPSPRRAGVAEAESAVMDKSLQLAEPVRETFAEAVKHASEELAATIGGSFLGSLEVSAEMASEIGEVVDLLSGLESDVPTVGVGSLQSASIADSVGLLWPALELAPSGAVGPGIAVTSEQVRGGLELKFGYYTNPELHGVTDISDEGRMFNEAVRRGHIPNTPEGLGTMLSYLGMAGHQYAPGVPVRPASVNAFFNEWFRGQVGVV